MKKIFLAALFLGMFTLSFAQSDYYNEYRKSVTDLDWKTVATELVLTPAQQSELNTLNKRYEDYNTWLRTYGDNPDRWRTERFSEMERIMGREKYQQFKSKYYKGQDPAAYYNKSKKQR